LKKKWNLAASLILIGSLLIGCTPEKEASKEASKEEGKGNPSKIEIVSSSMGLKYLGENPDLENDPYINKVEELTNTKLDIKVLPHVDFAKKLTLLFAGGELPDLLRNTGINSPEVAPAVEAGALQPLNELIDKYGPNIKKHIPDEFWKSSKISKDGKIYAIPQINPEPNPAVMYIRKDWLDKLGLEVPKTVDEYVNVLKAFRDKDPNGNGKNDEIPISWRPNFAYGFTFFGAFDVNPINWSYENGELIPDFIKPEMKEALALHKELYQEKLIDQEIFVQDSTDWESKIKGKANVGMWMHSPKFADKWMLDVKQTDPNAEVINIPAPIGQDGKGGYSITSPLYYHVWSIPASNENPEEVIKFLDSFYSKDLRNLVSYGLEGVDHKVENGEIAYQYPETEEELTREEFHLYWLNFAGPFVFENKAYMKGKPNGEIILNAMKIAESEGRENDGANMPQMPTLMARPELDSTKLWNDFAAKVITGNESVDNFDQFVEDWKSRGGEKLIKETTEWYKSK
jgi:putative aldouronate transport system substrate-binding protein